VGPICQAEGERATRERSALGERGERLAGGAEWSGGALHECAELQGPGVRRGERRARALAGRGSRAVRALAEQRGGMGRARKQAREKRERRRRRQTGLLGRGKGSGPREKEKELGRGLVC